MYKRQGQGQINLPFITADATGPKHLDMTLTRAKFNELTADLVDRTTVSYTHLKARTGRCKGAGRHQRLHRSRQHPLC